MNNMHDIYFYTLSEIEADRKLCEQDPLAHVDVLQYVEFYRSEEDDGSLFTICDIFLPVYRDYYIAAENRLDVILNYAGYETYFYEDSTEFESSEIEFYRNGVWYVDYDGDIVINYLKIKGHVEKDEIIKNLDRLIAAKHNFHRLYDVK